MSKSKNKEVKPDEVKAPEVVEETAKVEETKEVAEETPVKEKPVKKETAKVVEDKESHLYHVELDKPVYDKATGKKLSKPFIQKFTEAEYKQFENNSKGLGFQIKVIKKPTKKK